MNKKILSTVMAGTMLATSVAPALAYEINSTEVKEFKVSKIKKDDFTNNMLKIMEDRIVKDSGGSVYGIRKDGDSDDKVVFFSPNVNVSIDGKPILTEEEKLEHARQPIKNLITDNDKLEIIDRGHTIKDYEYYHYYQNDEYQTRQYTEELLNAEAESYKNDQNRDLNYPLVKSMSYNNGVLTIILTNNKEIKLTKNDSDIEPTIALDENGNEITDINNFDHFETRILNSKKYLFNTREIENFKKYFDDNKDKFDYIKSFEKDNFNVYIELKDNYTFNNAQKLKIGISSRNFPDFNKPVFADKSKSKIIGFKDYETRMFKGQKGDQIDGKVVARIEFSEDKDAITDLSDIFNDKDLFPPKPERPEKPDNGGGSHIVIPPIKPVVKPVETIAGSDRYNTAVEVAEQIAPAKEIAENGSVVLVNGNSLVDGLAAAPLAATLSKTGKVKSAPILLTKADKLTSSTKEYIEELVSKKTSSSKLKVYIVGGEAVVSKNIEKELNDLGVEVVRANGKDREATSLEVANLISKKSSISNAFVVGANGEADAMSIASVAASKKQPIIVSKNSGLSKEAINKISSYDAYATIVGGEKVVSKAEEKALKDANISTDRLAGSNRQATNAKVINRYSSDIDKVLISKDGQNKKDELVDALTATSLAVKYNAPIVLATDKISDGQVKAIKDNASLKGISISQIGYGVSSKVIDTISEVVGLIK